MQANAEATPQPSRLRRLLIGRSPKRTVVRALVLAVASLFVFTVVLRPVHVKGISMMPTYKDGSLNFMLRLAYLFHEPQRGDVVTVRIGTTDEVALMKRIVGMPGETIAFHEGRIVIDGQVLEEPYMDFLKKPCTWEIPPRKIGPDQYYVVGDNRTMQPELHDKGLAYRNKIMGRIVL